MSSNLNHMSSHLTVQYHGPSTKVIAIMNAILVVVWVTLQLAPSLILRLLARMHCISRKNLFLRMLPWHPCHRWLRHRAHHPCQITTLQQTLDHTCQYEVTVLLKKLGRKGKHGTMDIRLLLLFLVLLICRHLLWLTVHLPNSIRVKHTQKKHHIYKNHKHHQCQVHKVKIVLYSCTDDVDVKPCGLPQATSKTKNNLNLHVASPIYCCNYCKLYLILNS